MKYQNKCDNEKIAYACEKTCGLCPKTRTMSLPKTNDKQECSCEPYKYLCSGVVPLGKGDVVCSFNFWARQYKVEFDIQVTKELPAKPNSYYNVFRVTLGEDRIKYGDRIP